MKSIVSLAFIALQTLSLCAAAAPKNRNRVPDTLDAVRLIDRAAANYNHVLVVNVAEAIPSADWPLVVTYAASKLQINIWTNSIPSASVCVPNSDKSKIRLYVENTDSPDTITCIPGKSCHINVRSLTSDNPDAQTVRDRYAKIILKGLAYASGAGASADFRSATGAATMTLQGLDRANIGISPDSYFPMLEMLNLIGGEEMVVPAVSEE